MGLLGRQLNLERDSEDSLLLALSTLTFTTSLFAGYQENGIGQLVSLPLFQEYYAYYACNNYFIKFGLMESG